MQKNVIDDVFGTKVFNDDVMQQYLPKKTYAQLKDTIENGEELAPEVANVVAHAMKEWALSNGATHYTHWFQPMTGVTAEKHDSFLSPASDAHAVLEFSGKELIKGEPDASSFPSGGLRATFEARGYTAWDCTSPAFLREDAIGTLLCIPTAFCSYTGEALDKKTPLLRSMEAISKQAVRILKLFGNEDVSSVRCSVGPEQEYFLIDRDMFLQRDDLIFTGRTLFGSMPPKGQELDDHYFGTIRERQAAFMKELNDELWKLGILAKTQHNEVAPAQHEMAPIYSTANIAADHNQLVMEIMKKVARRHNFECLLHEKPFAGVNGSGKHDNWSLVTNTGMNLLSPGKAPYDNKQFLLFLSAVIAAVDSHSALLRLSASNPGNDHRLGANEAPPAIISIFLGEQLEDIVEQILKDGTATHSNKGERMDIGVHTIPPIKKDATDRNRTSPFAFTGNRFEFRAVGSSANCASAMIALNAAIAEQLMDFKTKVDARIAAGEGLDHALLAEVKEILRESKAIHFDGNGYSDEWKEEAGRRGLDCETSAPKIFDAYLSPSSIEMFSKTGVFTKLELEARNEVKWEMYTKKLQIEARVLGDLAINHVIPVAIRYQSVLTDNVFKLKTLFPNEKGDKLAAMDLDTIERISTHMATIMEEVKKMVNARKAANKIDDEREKAIAYHDNVLPCMDVIRYHIDKLELMVDDEMWPLPKYRELLFIR